MGGKNPRPGIFTFTAGDLYGDDAVIELNRLQASSSAAEAELYAELPTDIAGVQVEIEYNPDKVRLNSPLKTGMSEKLSLRHNDKIDGLRG